MAPGESQTRITVLLGVTILTLFLVGLQTLTPARARGMITVPVTEIAPQTELARLEQQLLSTQAQENQTLLALNARVGDRQSRVAEVLAQRVDLHLALGGSFEGKPQ